MSWVVCACMVCLSKNGIPCFNMKSVPLREDNIYDFCCPNGGVTFSVAQQQRFEILTELALINYAKGDFSGSAIKLYTSLERFFEFCQKIILFELGLTAIDVSNYWGAVRKSTERQIGAFLISCEISGKRGGRKWPALTKLNDLSSFRNMIVHQGLLPEAYEVRRFSEKILSYIVETCEFLKAEKSEALNRAILFHLDKGYSDARRRAERLLEESTPACVGTISLGLQLDLTKEYPAIDVDYLSSEAVKMEGIWKSGAANHSSER